MVEWIQNAIAKMFSTMHVEPKMLNASARIVKETSFQNVRAAGWRSWQNMHSATLRRARLMPLRAEEPLMKTFSKSHVLQTPLEQKTLNGKRKKQPKP